MTDHRLIRTPPCRPTAPIPPGAPALHPQQQQQQPGAVPSSAAALNGTPLTVAGKSYLVPTLRLPRGVSPEELRDGIQVRLNRETSGGI